MSKLTKELLTEIVPKRMKNNITDEVIDTINHLIEDPDFGEQFKEELLTYSNLLEHNPNWNIKNYMNAIKFYTQVNNGRTIVDAYCTTFPERLQRRLDKGETKADITGEASRYNKSQLVNKIREQALVPVHLTNQHLLQKMINEAARLATSAKSEMARVKAIDTLLGYLTPPETAKVEVDIKTNNVNAIDELRKATEELALQQLQSIKAGKAVKEMIEIPILEAELDE